jgi:hypothetical protein
VSADRPINADVPAPGTGDGDAPEQSRRGPEVSKSKPKPDGAKPDPKPSRPPRRRPRRQRKPIPGALKLIAALVVVAIAFIAAAVLGGSGGPKGGSESAGPAPVPSAESPPPAASPASETGEELGYPTFATANTTRVGGTDPAANAAAVALAAFPSTSPAQRPAAVTLVDEGDWAGAIAASVLMAAPVRAPILFSGGGDVPDTTAEALSALDPKGTSASAGTAAFAIDEAAAPDGIGKVTRVKTGSAAATAAAIADLRDSLFGAPPAHIVIAPSAQPGIAMPAAAWAARSGDPVLFTGADALPQPTAAFVEAHPKVPLYILGPSSAISSDLFRQLAKIGGKVKRISGEDAVANAIAFARYADGSFGWNINDPGHGFVLARDDSPADAAAAAPLSASGTWGPLLLTDNADTLPAELRSYFLDVKPGYTTNPTRAFYNHVWVIGDQEAIDVNQQAEVNGLAELAKIGGGAP